MVKHVVTCPAAIPSSGPNLLDILEDVAPTKATNPAFEHSNEDWSAFAESTASPAIVSRSVAPMPNLDDEWGALTAAPSAPPVPNTEAGATDIKPDIRWTNDEELGKLVDLDFFAAPPAKP